MNLFDLEHNKVVIHPEALLIKEFKDIWENDTSKDKIYAKEDLGFVAFWCHYKSLYKNYDEDIRESKIIKDIITRPNWKKTKLIDAAIVKFKELHTTYSMGLLNDVEYGLSKLRQYFRKTAEILADDVEGKATDKYLSNVRKVQELVSSIKGLKNLIEQEINENNRIRGGGALGNRELPKNKRK